jgi:hypothetical protein
MERKRLKRSTLLFCFILLAIIVSPLFLVVFIGSIEEQSSGPEFFVGVEYAIKNGSVEECKALVDRVKNFTNLFVVDTFEMTRDINNLTEVCDYVYDSGLYFMVFFISQFYEREGEYILRYNYYPHIWILEAKEKYGDKFLGIYAMDEPGGSQLDQADFRMINAEDVKSIEAAKAYIDLLNIHIDYYINPYVFFRIYDNYTVLTADYGLYWFDYKAGYTVILTEFGWNHSRPLHVALCRGAANVQNKEWGIIETWTYNNEPYLTSGAEVYDDLVLAYNNGARYAVIFDHPNTEYSKYGILTDEHFKALKDFWNYINNNPNKHGTVIGEVAYVLPENFGFGFRSADDKIWGVEADRFSEKFGQWSTEELAEKVWGDVNQLLDEYGSKLDIVYSDPEYNAELPKLYDKLFFWNQTIT